MFKLKLKKTILYNEELIVLHICLYHKGLTVQTMVGIPSSL